MWLWRRVERISWAELVTNYTVLQRAFADCSKKTEEVVIGHIEQGERRDRQIEGIDSMTRRQQGGREKGWWICLEKKALVGR